MNKLKETRKRKLGNLILSFPAHSFIFSITQSFPYSLTSSVSGVRMLDELKKKLCSVNKYITV